MLIQPRFFWIPVALLILLNAGRPISGSGQLKPGDFVTFMIPEAASNHPEPRDPNVRLGVGGSAVEQPTDVLVYAEGTTKAFAGRDGIPGLCASGTTQAAELIDPEGKRPRRTITIITTHPNAAIPAQTRLEELQIFSKCLDADDKVYIEYMGTFRAAP